VSCFSLLLARLQSKLLAELCGTPCLPSESPAQGQNLSHGLLAINLARKEGAQSNYPPSIVFQVVSNSPAISLARF
jgi:hypothetical protein